MRPVAGLSSHCPAWESAEVLCAGSSKPVVCGPPLVQGGHCPSATSTTPTNSCCPDTLGTALLFSAPLCRKPCFWQPDGTLALLVACLLKAHGLLLLGVCLCLLMVTDASAQPDDDEKVGE